MAAAAISGLVLSVLPPAYMLWRAIDASVGERVMALDTRQRGLLLTTTLLGLLTTTCATAVGVPLGITLARVPLPLKNVLRLMLVAPAVLPPYVVALAWTYLDTPATYSLAGAVVVLTVALYPLSLLATEVALRGVES